MRQRQGLVTRGVTEAQAQLLRHHVRHARIERLQRGVDGAANGAGTKGGDGFVDRHDAADLGGVDFLTGSGFIRGVRGGGVIDAAEQLDLRIHHLEARGTHFVDFCFPVQHQELALLQPAFEIAAVKEFAGEEACRILHQQMVNGVAAARCAHGLAAHHARADGVNAVGLNVLDVAEMDASS